MEKWVFCHIHRCLGLSAVVRSLPIRKPVHVHSESGSKPSRSSGVPTLPVSRQALPVTNPFDCHAALQNWDARWSSKKKARLRAPWGRMVGWDEVVKRLLPCCAVSQIPRYGTSVSLYLWKKSSVSFALCEQGQSAL